MRCEQQPTERHTMKVKTSVQAKAEKDAKNPKAAKIHGEGEYNGKPTLTLDPENENQFGRFTFGVGKAHKILANLDRIKLFAAKYPLAEKKAKA